jgi:hypothetical protein
MLGRLYQPCYGDDKPLKINTIFGYDPNVDILDTWLMPSVRLQNRCARRGIPSS